MADIWDGRVKRVKNYIFLYITKIYKNIKNITMSIKLMKDLQFAEKLNSTNAISEAGKELLNNYRAYVYSNAPTCAVVNAFVNEAQKYSFDAGVSTILESVKNLRRFLLAVLAVII